MAVGGGGAGGRVQANPLVNLSRANVEDALGFTVPDLFVTIAKHLIYGMSPEGIAEVLNVEAQEVTELKDSNEEFKAVYGYIAGEFARRSVETDSTWDALEYRALQNLEESIQFNHDPELNLRVAAVANKAQRRHRVDKGHLDPALGGSQVQLQLTQRFVQKLSAGIGVSTTEEVRTATFSITDKARNPTFAEVDKLLGVTARREAIVNVDSVPDNIFEDLI